MSEPVTHVVLDQYREGSDWADEIGKRYHFPNGKGFLPLLKKPNVKFIYFEPGKKGRSEFFGFGEIGKITTDPNSANQSFAEILNYRPFERPVPAKSPTDEKWEKPPLYNPRNSVRRIDPAGIASINWTGK